MEVNQCKNTNVSHVVIYNLEEGDSMFGIDASVSFEDLPDDWLCPICRVGKDQFEPLKD